MAMADNKYMSEALLSKEPEKKLGLKLKDGCVTTEKIADKAVTPEKLSDDVNNTLATLDAEVKEMQHYIESHEEFGVAVSDHFGQNHNISISQKTLTNAITQLWDKIGDITGETYGGLTMTVTPDCFYSDEGCDISISANKANAAGPFEVIRFFVDDVLVGEFKDVDIVRPEDFEQPVHIDATSVIKCVAQIMGVEYELTKTITKKPNFWIGAGNHYTDVMTDANLIDFGPCMRASKDITFSNGNYLIIVMGAGFMEQFIRVDMNGFEIPMNEPQPVGEYYMLTSKSTFIAGTYNIDING